MKTEFFELKRDDRLFFCYFLGLYLNNIYKNC